MSKAFYNFQGTPFAPAIGLDPQFIYLSKNYEMPLAILVSSLDKGVDLVLITGEKGVGKTTLIEYLNKNIQINFALGFISGCSQSQIELLQNTMQSFGLKVDYTNRQIMLQQLQDFLSLKFDQQNQQPSLLVIDNANGMGFEALQGIELLLAFNQDARKLLQIILVGNLELQSLLNQPELQSLSDSIGTTCPLEPLSNKETQAYIYYQLKAAGLDTDNLPFDQQSCSEVYKYSDGLPEKINSICNDVLSESSSRHQYKVSVAQIRKIIERNVYLDIPAVAPAKVEPVTKTINNRKTAVNVLNPSVIFIGLIIGVSLFLVLKWNKFFKPPEDTQILASNSSEENPNQQINNPPLTKPVKASEKQQKSSELAEKQTIDRSTLPSETTKSSSKQLTLNTNESENKQKSQISESKLAILNNKLNKLYEKADQQLAELKLTSPKNDNAYESFQAILSLAPSDERALNGIQRIANGYLGLAKKQQSEGLLDKSLVYINQGLKILPDHKQLAKLKEQVVSEQARKIDLAQVKTLAKQVAQAETSFQAELQKNKDQKLSADTDDAEKSKNVDFAMLQTQKTRSNEQLEILLREAKQQLKAQRLLKPSGDNAFESYQRVLTIDPGNEAAQKGLIFLENNYQTLTKDALSQGNTDQAMMFASDGLIAFPNNLNLQELRNNIALQRDKAAKEIEEKKRQKERKLKPFANF